MTLFVSWANWHGSVRPIDSRSNISTLSSSKHVSGLGVIFLEKAKINFAQHWVDVMKYCAIRLYDMVHGDIP